MGDKQKLNRSYLVTNVPCTLWLFLCDQCRHCCLCVVPECVWTFFPFLTRAGGLLWVDFGSAWVIVLCYVVALMTSPSLGLCSAQLQSPFSPGLLHQEEKAAAPWKGQGLASVGLLGAWGAETRPGKARLPGKHSYYLYLHPHGSVFHSWLLVRPSEIFALWCKLLHCKMQRLKAESGLGEGHSDRAFA